MIASIMNQEPGNISPAAFKPWPTIGYGMAAYIGSAVVSVVRVESSSSWAM